jgi:hypothetical protein
MLPWHGLPIDARRMQVLPGVLRRYPGHYSLLQRVLARGLGLFRKLPGRTTIDHRPD